MKNSMSEQTNHNLAVRGKRLSIRHLSAQPYFLHQPISCCIRFRHPFGDFFLARENIPVPAKSSLAY